MKRITIKELAERLRLSPSTVSRALAGDRNIRRETRERVLRLAEESGYRPNPAAVNLRAGRSDTVGVIVPEMVTPFAATVIGGIQRVLYDRGLKVVIVQSDESPAVEREHLLLMERFMVEGIIACPCDATRNGEVYRRLRQRGVPLVFYDRAPLSVEAPKVVVDDFATSYFLTEHLVRRGCRRIVHLGGRRTFPMRGSACAGIAMPWRSSGLRRTEGRSSRRGSPSATAVRRPTSCCAACPRPTESSHGRTRWPSAR